jgi:hypothetical protein
MIDSESNESEPLIETQDIEESIAKAKSKADAESSEQSKTKASSNRVVFGNSIEIDFSEEKPEYSNRVAKAYTARGINGDDSPYFAMICHKALTPRNRRASAYASIGGGPMAFLVASGVVTVPESKQEAFVFIYKDTLGNRITEEETEVSLGWKPETSLQRIVTPVIACLKDLREVDMVHGAVRPNNFYDGGKSDFQNIVLGECLSAPASALQPAVFESLHRCTAQPTGRGTGLIEDDLYALGVSLAMVLRTKNPMKGKSDDDIIRYKMQHGSYTTLIDKEDRFTGAVLELLRGLLIDDQRQRWSLDDVLSWLDGRRLSPKQTRSRKRAARAITFNGKSYYYLESLANDLFHKPAEAVSMIEGHDLEAWITRSIDDKAAKARLDSAVLSAKESGKSAGYWDRLLARTAIAMDPEGPIRFKTLSVRPEGLGTALAEAFVKNGDLQAFTEIFQSPLLQFYLVTCTDLNIEVSDFISKFDNCKNLIRQKMVGFGLERCLYYLNESTPCLSPILKKYYARSPEDIVRSFDKIAQEKRRPPLAIDRHIAAYIAAKDAKYFEPNLYDINSVESHRRLIGILNMFAAIQKGEKLDPLPHLSEWISETVTVIIDRFHDKEQRDYLKKNLKKLSSQGDLVEIAQLLNTEKALKRDYKHFRAAIQEYKSYDREHANLKEQLEKPELYGKHKGREIAIIVSGVLSAIIILGFCTMYASGQSIMFSLR